MHSLKSNEQEDCHVFRIRSGKKVLVAEVVMMTPSWIEAFDGLPYDDSIERKKNRN